MYFAGARVKTRSMCGNHTICAVAVSEKHDSSEVLHQHLELDSDQVAANRQERSRSSCATIFVSFYFWESDIFILMHHLCASRKQKKKKVGEGEMKLQNSSSCLDEGMCV